MSRTFTNKPTTSQAGRGRGTAAKKSDNTQSRRPNPQTMNPNSRIPGFGARPGPGQPVMNNPTRPQRLGEGPSGGANRGTGNCSNFI